MRDKIEEILNLIKNNNFKEAEEKCEYIRDRLENNVQFLNIYGYVCLSLQHYEKAIDQWHKAITIDPKFVDGLNNLGNAFSKIKKFDEAIDYLNKALKLRPIFFKPYNTLSKFFLEKRINKN